MDAFVLDDLVRAYYKAKVDCFYETGISTMAFVNYEKSLPENLLDLLKRIRSDNAFPSECKHGWMPKCTSRNDEIHAKTKGTIVFSNPLEEAENTEYDLEWRTVGKFSVEEHVLSALWTIKIGSKWDERLSSNCYGTRVRRVVARKRTGEEQPFHHDGLGTFGPYWVNYQRWRDGAWKVVRSELGAGRHVRLISIDLRRFYPSIDVGSFIKSEQHRRLKVDDGLRVFHDSFMKYVETFTEGLPIGLGAARIIANVVLHPWDEAVERDIQPLYYGRYVDDMLFVIPGDNERTQDDIFGRWRCLLECSQRTVKLERVCKGEADEKKDPQGDGAAKDEPQKEHWKINLDSTGQEELEINPDKTRVYVLDREAGTDMLDLVEAEMKAIGSERRLMPTPADLGTPTKQRILRLTTAKERRAIGLRSCDGVSLERYGWSVYLSHVEILTQDLDADEWAKMKGEFYRLIRIYIANARDLVDHGDKLLRIVTLATSLGDFAEIETLWNHVVASVRRFVRSSKSGSERKDDQPEPPVSHLFVFYGRYFIDGILSGTFVGNEQLSKERAKKSSQLIDNILSKRAIPAPINKTLLDYVVDTIWQPGFGDSFDACFHHFVREVFNRDLGYRPFHVVWTNIGSLQRSFAASSMKPGGFRKVMRHLKKKSSFGTSFRSRWRTVSQFVDIVRLLKPDPFPQCESGKRSDDDLMKNVDTIFFRAPALLFPTRPMSAGQIEELLPHGFDDVDTYVNAIRGAYTKIEPIPPKPNDNSVCMEYMRSTAQLTMKMKVGLASMLTSNDAWNATARQRPILSRDRYDRVARIINQAIEHKVEVLVLPEVSIPIEWLDTVCKKLSDANITLIAGTEYFHIQGNKLFSSAIVSTPSDSYGYRSAVRRIQPKRFPAPHEEYDLIRNHGKEWMKQLPWVSTPLRPERLLRNLEADKIGNVVFEVGGSYWGILVCSELQNAKRRIHFQGKIDTLFVLSWNKDLSTFSSLIESATLDLHTYCVYANNREYGDSRIRAPYKKRHKRDLARVHGGCNDQLVVVDIDVNSLRKAHARSKSWPEDKDTFKPTPEDFEPSSYRTPTWPKESSNEQFTKRSTELDLPRRVHPFLNDEEW